MTAAAGVPPPTFRSEAGASLSRPRWLWLACALLMSAAPAGAQSAEVRAMIAEVVRTGSVIVRGVSFEKGAEVPSSGSRGCTAPGDRGAARARRVDLRSAGSYRRNRDAAQDQALSTARAKAVVAWLTGEGIAAARLVPRGYGSTKPPARTATGEPAVPPRRLELKKLNEE